MMDTEKQETHNAYHVMLSKVEDDSFNLIKYLSSSECDIQKICRLCLNVKDKEMVTLISTLNSAELAYRLLPFIDETTSEVDLPQNICCLCQVEIMRLTEFISKCEKSDSTLKSILKGEYVKDEYDIKLESELLEPLDSFKHENESNDDIVETLYADDNDISTNSVEVEIQDMLETSTLTKVLKKSKKKSKSFDVSKSNSLQISNLNQTQNASSCNITPKSPLEERQLEPNTIKCVSCKETFISQRDCDIHSAIHTHKGGKWKCIECQKDFNAKSNLRRHIKRHMDNKKYKCDFCPKTFCEQYAKWRHLRVHTGESIEKKYACTICEKRFVAAGPWRAHQAMHAGTRDCVCALCDKRFVSARLLASHMRIHDDRKEYACTYCDRRFRHESTRTAHQRTHTGERPYVCSTCGKTFMQSSNLTLHTRVHSGERPYACSLCDWRFASSSALKSHTRSHTGEKPYSCKFCGQKFAHSDMRVHLRGHTGERPYKCTVCSQAFATASRLKEHTVVVHTGDRPFECAVCQSKYPTKSHLIKHIKAHKKSHRPFECAVCHSKYPTKLHLIKHIKAHKQSKNKELFIVHRVTDDTPYFISDNIFVGDKTGIAEEVVISQQDTTHEINDLTTGLHHIPLEIEQNDSRETEILAVENLHTDNQSISLANDSSYELSNVNLVTVREGEMSIAATSATVEGATVKLYHLDHSLVQIHSTGNQVTISKITSKVTANFE